MGTESRVLRYQVPVDDQWHTIDLGPAEVLHVAARDSSIVEFWAISSTDPLDLPDPRWQRRQFRVFGTGQPLQTNTQYRGTALANGGLVWHLFEVTG